MSVRPTTPSPSGVSLPLVYPASKTPWVYFLGASKIPVSEGAPEGLASRQLRSEATNSSTVETSLSCSEEIVPR